MPRILRHHSLPRPEDTWSESDVADDGNDFDGEIHLSSLLRTAEASRLRRRGAVRHAPVHPHRPGSPSVVIVDAVSTPSSVSDYEREPLGTGAAHRRRHPRERHARREMLPKIMADEGHFSLFCGAPDDRPLPDTTPFQPSIFPTAGLDPKPRHLPQRMNGCGALLHLHGSPSDDQGVWLAKGSAMDTVVGMDAQYFDRPAIAKAVHSSCGCIREGVGCSVCGNPLGTRYKPCQSAGNSILSSSTKPPGTSSPEGPRNWRSSLSSPHGRFTYIYTFFSSAVSSYPEHAFPSRQSSRPPLQSSSTLSDSSSAPSDVGAGTIAPPMFDRFMTSSPQPLSESDETAHEEEETRFAYWRDTIASYPFLVDNANNTSTELGSLSRQTTLRPDQLLVQTEFDPDGEFLGIDQTIQPVSQDKAFEPALFP